MGVAWGVEEESSMTTENHLIAKIKDISYLKLIRTHMLTVFKLSINKV